MWLAVRCGTDYLASVYGVFASQFDIGVCVCVSCLIKFDLL